MFASTLLPFLLFTACFAAPSRRQAECINGDAISIPQGQTVITRPNLPLQFITVGYGNQNYTCSSGKYMSTGAVVQVYDISKTFGTAFFYNAQDIVYADWLAYPGDDVYDQNFVQQVANSYGIDNVGQHFFQNGYNGIVPIWGFTQTYGPKAVVAAKVVGDLPSTNPYDVDSVELTATSGELAKEILRLYPKGGAPPSSCMSGDQDISVKFTTFYALYGGSIGHCGGY